MILWEEPMNTDDVLNYGHQTVVEAVKGLPVEAWYTPGVCGVWSVKEIIAHLASFEQMLVDVLNSLLDDTLPTPTLDRLVEDYVTFNDAEVEARRHKTAEEVWAEYNEAYTRAAALLARIPYEGRRLNGVLAWYGPDYDLEDFITYSFYGHKREHCAQIAVFRDRLAEAEGQSVGHGGDSTAG
jgi:hypothetical protein